MSSIVGHALTMDPRSRIYRGTSTLAMTDGYENHDLHGYEAVERMQASIRRERRIAELRELIHRCDEGAIRP